MLSHLVPELPQLTFLFYFQGNLDERCTDALIWELVLQAGPVGEFPWILLCRYDSLSLFTLTVNVHLPKDRISMAHQGYGFCEFLTEEDAEYACKIMNQIKLWGKPIRVNKVRFRFHIVLREARMKFFMWTLLCRFGLEC